ncbi:MAG: pilus assembly protein [Candidatus Aureabacteria bacterium]|nr:pilus assembly protein [Candidatus Auribacterota bacterium]
MMVSFNMAIMKLKKRFLKKKGSAIVEFALVIPLYLLALCCFFQLVLIMHARLLLTYASFCAARAGIVSKADPNSMKEAASMAMSSLYVTTDSKSKISQGKNKAMQDFNNGNLSIQILTNPNIRTRLNQVKTLDQLSQSEKVLRIRLRYNFPLKIPVANRLFYEFLNFNLAVHDTVGITSPQFLGYTTASDMRIPMQTDYFLRITTRSKDSLT